MSGWLLQTKLHIPSPRLNLVSRPRLIRRLDEALRAGHRLTLISAPAGFGKTTLLAPEYQDLYDKLDVHSRNETVDKARQMGIL